MKIESITKEALLAAYIKQEYADTEVLVIDWDGNVPREAFDMLIEDLSAFAPPLALREYSSYIIIEMPGVLAQQIARNRYAPNVQVWICGEMIARN